MNLLLDTHALLWFVWDDTKLSQGAKEAIEDTANLKFVSIATCWEISIKCGLNKLSLGELLPLHHRDPFDRLLIVQAQLESFTLVSCDQTLDQYGISRKW